MNTEIISHIPSDHNGVRLEINYKRKTRKITNMWRSNNTLLNNQWVNKDSKEKSKNVCRQMNMEIQLPKSME